MNRNWVEFALTVNLESKLVQNLTRFSGSQKPKNFVPGQPPLCGCLGAILKQEFIKKAALHDLKVLWSQKINNIQKKQEQHEQTQRKVGRLCLGGVMAYMSDDRHQGVSCLQSVDRRRGSDHNVNGFTIAAIQMGVSENGCTMVYPKMDGLQWKIMENPIINKMESLISSPGRELGQ